ncbi:MAG: F0F1 ATP synthase subunit delta, partial [Burkholderiales bacterium]
MSKASNTKLIIKRYAKALFELALEQKAIEVVEKDLIALKEYLQKVAVFADFCNNKLSSQHDLRSVMNDIANVLELSTLVKQFLQVLIESNHLQDLASCLNAF